MHLRVRVIHNFGTGAGRGYGGKRPKPAHFGSPTRRRTRGLLKPGSNSSVEQDRPRVLPSWTSLTASGRKQSARGRYNATARAWLQPLRQRDPQQFLRLLRRASSRMPPEYRQRYRMSLKGWLIYHQNNIVVDQCHWMGVPTLKNPLDAWIYQEILFETQPDIVVELGSAAGGTTLFLAQLLDLIGHGTVLSVDADRTNFHARHDRITCVTGMTTDPEVVRKVKEQCEGRSVMLIHDADHRKEQVLADLELYAPLVTVDCYLIVEDGIVDLFRPWDGLGSWKDGPMAATDEFLRDNPQFTVDSYRERYVMTYNPRGFLRRVAGVDGR